MILINVTSYNRLEMLNNLLDNFKDYHVIVWDDCSDFEFKPRKNVTFKRFPKNYGKKQAWDKFRQIFNHLKKTRYDYYFFLPDDSQPYENFIDKSIGLWESIKDERKICLSWANKERLSKPNWDSDNPKKVGDVILSGWTDLQFMCENDFFHKVYIEEVKESRWETDPTLGSGVGSKISRFLREYKWNMYHAEGMLKHLGNDNSLMNPEIRKIEKL